MHRLYTRFCSVTFMLDGSDVASANWVEIEISILKQLQHAISVDS